MLSTDWTFSTYYYPAHPVLFTTCSPLEARMSEWERREILHLLGKEKYIYGYEGSQAVLARPYDKGRLKRLRKWRERHEKWSMNKNWVGSCCNWSRPRIQTLILGGGEAFNFDVDIERAAWEMQCDVEFWYQLSICPGTKKNHEKLSSSWSVALLYNLRTDFQPAVDI
jgi:hypothetical protein